MAVVRSPVYQANKKLEQDAFRSLTAVRGRGYRVLLANEHSGVARRHQDRARRQVKRSVAVVRATDVTALTESERQWHDSMLVLSTALDGAMKYILQRIRRHETAIEEHQVRQEATSERLSIIEAGLRAAHVRLPEVIDVEPEPDDVDDA